MTAHALKCVGKIYVTNTPSKHAESTNVVNVDGGKSWMQMLLIFSSHKHEFLVINMAKEIQFFTCERDIMSLVTPAKNTN